jgi:polyisoprenoid-binding protein YceI
MRTLVIALGLISIAACSKQEVPNQVAAPGAAAEPTVTTAPIDVPAGAYTLDDAHASLLFRVDHLGFSNYTGRFKAFDADLQLDPQQLQNSTVNVSIDAKSLDVENPPEGFIAELLGASWLDAAQFPIINFRSTAVTVTAPNAVRIAADLTLHGITRPVVLDATFNGGYAGHPMDPNARIGFSARGSFNRSEFGIAYGVPAPGTKMGVSDAVEVIVEAEFSGPKWAAAPAAGEPATQT